MSKQKITKAVDVQVKDDMSDLKRKRSKDEPEEELEIDVNLPEPPSKKAKRKEKKAEKQKTKPAKTSPTDEEESIPLPNGKDSTQQTSTAPKPDAKQRSDHGIWIGNLNFTTTKDDLREFLQKEGRIPDTDITRVYLPPPRDGSEKRGNKNRGFAYIDFATADILARALTLTEKLLYGRKVLIKNAKSFEGRPDKPAEANEGGEKTKVGREPSKRIFVGNLGFDVTKDELIEHFSQAGEVEEVFLATFEDSGKCKGFGWVRFRDLEAAEAAVKGFIFKNSEERDDEERDGETEEGQQNRKKEKRRKWFINRLQGRELRCEFAEDSQTRWKKRFGKDSKAAKPAEAPIVEEVGGAQNDPVQTRGRERQGKPQYKPSMNQDERREERRKRHEKMDARKIAPGKALSGTQRASAAIVAGAGKKTSFD